MRHAFIADTLDKGVLLIVDLALLERSVVEQNLDAVRPGFFQPAHRPVVEKIGHASRRVRVVAGLFVGQQQALVMALLAGR